MMDPENTTDRLVVLDSDPFRRASLARTLRAAGFQVSTFGSIAEMERWPVGVVLLIDLPLFTPWWQSVGARQVMVMAPTPAGGQAACARGASAWISHTCTPEALITLARNACRTPHNPARDLRSSSAPRQR